MKTLSLGTAALSVVLFLGVDGPSSTGKASATDATTAPHGVVERPRARRAVPLGGSEAVEDADPVRSPEGPDNELVQRYCVRCHSDRRLRGNLSLERFDAETPETQAEVAEKMIRKLRAGMMPPPGARRPDDDVLTRFVGTLETRIDQAAFPNPDPGGRTFQRLNRAEYEASIRDLLSIEIDAGDYLPLDTKSANFDNIADVQLMSPTLLDAYLDAAADISRLAVGNPRVSASETQYRVPRWMSQVDRVEGAPFGTRGGTSVIHNFPADGMYQFRVSFHHETTGTVVGNGRSALHTAEAPEQVEISIDGERVALLDMDRWMHTSDPEGVNIRSEPVFVRSGPHRLTAAFIRRREGPTQDLVSPHDWSLASTAIAGTYGVLSLPHLRDLVVSGPRNPTGISRTPSREAIFSCYPDEVSTQRACAEEIVTRLGTRAYRRDLTAEDVRGLMAFYDSGAKEEGFETGVRLALEAILSSPHFVFRFETPSDRVHEDGVYRISDVALASRLSFFLWGGPPDDRLLALASGRRLSDRETLRSEVDRMLADPRAEALGSRFAAQWLRLQDLDKVHPDVRLQPDFHGQLAEAMRHETELFFNNLVAEDRSILELYDADYTFVNERLARHYGIDGVTGETFRKVRYPDDRRGGVLGHGSILTMTSHAGRTSPVLRGKWVMEVLLGTPPPPPPPNVPDLEATEEAEEGRLLTTRERMELHRASPTCNSCHRFIDPIGLALDNFGVSGRWRIREHGMPLDTRGELYDGTPLTSPADLRRALLERPIPLVRTFTENLMAYAIGRRVEYFDQPTVRAIARRAEEEGYRISAFIHGVVASDAFQKQRASVAVVDADAGPDL